MPENPPSFDPLESHIVARSADLESTRRRIRYSIAVPLLLIALTLVLFARDAQPQALLWMYLAYIVLNMFEKIGYGRAVLAYKRVIQKLLARVAELERQPYPR